MNVYLVLIQGFEDATDHELGIAYFQVAQQDFIFPSELVWPTETN